jgi:hypothetical protein
MDLIDATCFLHGLQRYYILNYMHEYMFDYIILHDLLHVFYKALLRKVVTILFPFDYEPRDQCFFPSITNLAITFVPP